MTATAFYWLGMASCFSSGFFLPHAWKARDRLWLLICGLMFVGGIGAMALPA